MPTQSHVKISRNAAARQTVFSPKSLELAFHAGFTFERTQQEGKLTMRRYFERLMALGLLLAMTAPAMAQKGNGKGGGGGDGGDPPSPLPNTRYAVVTYDTPLAGGQPFDINNMGKAVGFYYSDGEEIGYLAELSVDGQGNAVVDCTDLNLILSQSSGIPAGYWISRARDINDHGVLVGQLTNSAGSTLPYALDLGQPHPVVDLLPNVTGEAVYCINNAGDVAGLCHGVNGAETLWTLNLSDYYGDPATDRQTVRPTDIDGNLLPLDFSFATTVRVDQLAGSSRIALSERSSSDIAYISGTLAATPF